MSLLSNSIFSIFSLVAVCALCSAVIGSLQPAQMSEFDRLPLQGVKIQYYDIDGRTADELKEAMRTRGPVDEFGRRSYAYTSWHVQWRWPSRERAAEEVDLRGAEVSLSISLTLPRWSGYERASSHLRARWNRFSQALLFHELGHVAIAHRTQASLRERFHEIGTTSQQRAELVARSVSSRFLSADGHYDRRTQGGLSQGVFLR
ncbi:DUF922 domain-containing protein [bacterium]|nr:DUF922 domain-containing protein [bacterium]